MAVKAVRVCCGAYLSGVLKMKLLGITRDLEARFVAPIGEFQ